MASSSTQQSGLIALKDTNEHQSPQKTIAKLTPINLAGLSAGPSIINGESAIHSTNMNLDQDQLTNKNSLRKQSIDSLSSYTSNEHKSHNHLHQPSSETKNGKKKNLMIKKKDLRLGLNFANNLQPTQRLLAVDELERSYSNQFSNANHDIPPIIGANQQYITDHSDSDLSVFESQSLGSTTGVRNVRGASAATGHQNHHQIHNMPMINQSMISNINCITPLSSQRIFNIEGELRNQAEDINKVQFLNKITKNVQKENYHPFANKISPFEEWKQILILAIETAVQFMIYDICLNGLYFSWNCFMYTLLWPIGGIGLMIEYMRILKNKCKKSKEVDPFIRVAPPKTSEKLAFLHDKNYLEESEEAAMFRKQQENLSTMKMPERGDFIIVVDLDRTLVYSHPHKQDTSKSVLNDSYLTIQSLNLVSESTGGHYRVYKRPYLEKFLKRMSEMGQVHVFTASHKSYADPVIDMIDPNGYLTGRYYREHCKTDKNGNFIKQMDMITTNMTRLIIIDDSDIVYNMYKDNTIKVTPFIPNASAGKRQDKKLLDCIGIVEQLNCVTKFKDVRLNLKNIIDTENKYTE